MPQFAQRLVGRSQMERQSEQHGHGAQEEAQRLTGPHQRQSRRGQSVGLSRRRATGAVCQLEQLGLGKIGGQPRQRQRDDGRFRRSLAGATSSITNISAQRSVNTARYTYKPTRRTTMSE